MTPDITHDLADAITTTVHESGSAMRGIQRHLPAPRHVEIHRIFVDAPAAEAWEAARHFDASSIVWVRALFDLRTLPDRLFGHGEAAEESEDRHVGIDQIAERNEGFMVLEETPGREIVIGAVGRFWHLAIPFATVPPERFRDFDEEGWGKVAWSIAVEPYGHGSTVALELRTTATDEASWRRLTRYFHLIGPFSHLIRGSVMSHLEASLGAMERPDDRHRPLFGDDRISDARYALTHAIDIEAHPALVWRYLMQLGCDRAGWYSIDLLDHGGEPSVDHLVEGWEERRPGDTLQATPELDGGFEVYAVEPERALLTGLEMERHGGPFAVSWAFILEPIGADATHLITRVRMKAAPPLSEWIQGNLIAPPIHALMQKAQLGNIKRLAERDAQQRDASWGGERAQVV